MIRRFDAGQASKNSAGYRSRLSDWAERLVLYGNVSEWQDQYIVRHGILIPDRCKALHVYDRASEGAYRVK